MNGFQYFSLVKKYQSENTSRNILRIFLINIMLAKQTISKPVHIFFIDGILAIIKVFYYLKSIILLYFCQAPPPLWAKIALPRRCRAF